MHADGLYTLFTLPQKLVFAEKYGVGPRWLPATLLKILGMVSREIGAQGNRCDIAGSTDSKAFLSGWPDNSSTRTDQSY